MNITYPCGSSEEDKKIKMVFINEKSIKEENCSRTKPNSYYFDSSIEWMPLNKNAILHSFKHIEIRSEKLYSLNCPYVCYLHLN